MKELSIEEKARRYDEAIERGKQIQNTPYTAHWDIMKEVAEHILPELKESEDEKIRREMIFYFNEEIPQCSIQEHADKMKEFVAWLEKQGKQKPTEPTDLRTWKYIVDAVLTEREGIGQYLDSPWTTEVAGKLQKRFGSIEQKSVEWSQENLICLGYLADFVDKNGDAFYGENKPNVVKWVRSLAELPIHEHINDIGQKPVELNERYIAEVFEKVGLAKVVRELANDNLTNALQDAMIELSTKQKPEWSEEV